jgi:UDP-glucose 4-epimerase
MVLFQVMEKHSVRKIVFSSSATVYSSHNTSPLTEEMSLSTTNPYGTTKLIIEKILEDLGRDSGWSSIALRYFNPIGAHPSGEIGESPSGIPNNLLPYILDVARGEREKVNIYGDDYNTQDGT